MSLNINVVVQSGVVQWPALRYDAQGKPEFRWTLVRQTTSADGQVFTLSLPGGAVGKTAEQLAADLNEGDSIVVTQGELVYRKRQTKTGEQSRLEILAWRVQQVRPEVLGASVVTEAAEPSTADPPAK